jgi:hypothetical protein
MRLSGSVQSTSSVACRKTGGLTLADQRRDYFFGVLRDRFPDLLPFYERMYPHPTASYGGICEGDPRALGRRIRELWQRAQEVRRQRADLRTQLRAIQPPREPAIIQARAFLGTLGELWDRATLAQKHKLLQCTVRKVRADFGRHWSMPSFFPCSTPACNLSSTGSYAIGAIEQESGTEKPRFRSPACVLL